MPIWLVLAGSNGGLRGTRVTETPRIQGTGVGGGLGELLTVLAQGNRGVRISGFVVLPLLSPLLPFDGFVMRWWRKGGGRALDAAAHNTTTSAGTNSHPSESFVLR